MYSLWRHYNKDYEKYERDHPLAYPWKRGEAEDVARYVQGEDGYWYDPAAPESGTALISCVGDLMCEPRMTNACRFGDAYFFHPLFQYVRGILKNSDLSVANLETTLSDSTPYAGEYHRINRQFHCNGPECYLDALRYAGFDALVTANNHNCDSGITGLFETLRAVSRHEFMRTGTFLPTDSERVLLIKVRGIRCAVLSYATRYNSIDTRNFTKEGVDTVLNYYSKEKIDRDTAYAREHGAEFIICYIHWGVDYDLVPGERQLTVFETLKEADVDYIVGSHTHCLQAHNVAVSSAGRKIPMMFSMGNFVTNEPKELCKHTGILQLGLKREGNGISVKEYFIPCYVFDELHGGRFAVCPTDPILNGGYHTEKMDAVEKYVRERVGEEIDFLPTGTVALDELAEAMGATLPEQMRGRLVTRLCCEVGPTVRGAVYFANGNEGVYAVRELIRRELAAVVASEPIEGLDCIIVDDVRAAFLSCAGVADRHSAPIKRIMIAGNEGKTLTAELSSAALRTSYRVLCSADSDQNDVFSLQAAHPTDELCIFELRDSYPIGKDTVAKAVHPDVCVLTGMTLGLSDVLDSVTDGGLVLINGGDSELTMALGELDTSRLTVKEFSSEPICEALCYSDMHLSSSAAFKLAIEFGIDEACARESIRTYKPRSISKSILDVDEIRLLLNLNAKSERSALASAERLAQEPGRKICVVGNISDGSDLYGIVGALAKAGAEYIFVLSEAYGDEITVDGTSVIKTARERELETEIMKVLEEGDTVMLLGSRESGVSTAARRLFGIIDGVIPNSEYRTGAEKLDY